jgi:NitT/TauT family transport system ATP-binding protein
MELPPLARAENVTHGFAGLRVLDRLNLQVRQGEFVSVLGPSGCGKTVLLKMFAGLLWPSSGSVAVNARTALSFQRSPMFPWLDLTENVLICMNQEGLDAAAKRELLGNYFRLARLEGFEDSFPAQVSGGMQQKVNVIRAFCSGADLILMDEPFVSLDFVQRLELQALTTDLWSRDGKTILFVTHDVDEAIFLSDRICVLSQRPARLISEFEVDIPRPRSIEDVRRSGDYARLFTAVSGALRDGAS